MNVFQSKLFNLILIQTKSEMELPRNKNAITVI